MKSWRHYLAVLLLVGLTNLAIAQQTNVPTAALSVDASPYDVIGFGPTFSSVYTDTPVTASILGLPYHRYLLLAGTYVPHWFHGAPPQLTIDIGFANVTRIIVDGFRAGVSRYTTGIDGQSHLTYVYPGEQWQLGALGAIQAVIEDPTSAYNLRSSAAVVVNLVAGYKEYELSDNDFGSIALADGFLFPFYGAVYSQVYLSANGYLAFDPPSTAQPVFGDFVSGAPSIAAFFADLDPSSGTGDTSVSSRQYRVGDSWALKVSFEFVPEKGINNVAHSFDITLFSSGLIEMYWSPSNLDPFVDVTTGISPGNNIDGTTPSSDISAFDNSFQPFAEFQSIYESFDNDPSSPTLNSFDLNDRTIQFYPDAVYALPLSYSIY